MSLLPILCVCEKVELSLFLEELNFQPPSHVADVEKATRNRGKKEYFPFLNESDKK